MTLWSPIGYRVYHVAFMRAKLNNFGSLIPIVANFLPYLGLSLTSHLQVVEETRVPEKKIA